MGILIGMDEAGYGPQLGPLVVAATAWEVHGELASASGSTRKHSASIVSVASDCGSGTGILESAIRIPQSAIAAPPIDLYRVLRTVVSRAPRDGKIAIADSKALYKPGSGLRHLERGLHAVCSSLGQSHSCWSSLLDATGADPDGHHRQLPWHEGFDCPLPVDATAEELANCGKQMHRACGSAGVRPLAIRARLVFPAEFNVLCEQYGSKGAALSHVTIGLLRDTVDLSRKPPDPKPQTPVFAVCDKHGGRNFYAAILQHHFPDHWIQPVHESRAESRYEWGDDERRMEVVFRTKGEEYLPTALASMTAKYLRELSMRAFNEFWCARVPNLRPTAGYPGDAARFRRDVEAMQRELQIDDHVMWRNR